MADGRKRPPTIRDLPIVEGAVPINEVPPKPVVKGPRPVPAVPPKKG
jgi:hypothetical protein